jgi:hypothetical protein
LGCSIAEDHVRQMWKMRNKIIVFAKNVIYMDKALEYDGIHNNYVALQNHTKMVQPLWEGLR